MGKLEYPPDNFSPTPLHLALERIIRLILLAQDEFLKAANISESDSPESANRKWIRCADQLSGLDAAYEMIRVGMPEEEYNYWIPDTFRNNKELTYLPKGDIINK